MFSILYMKPYDFRELVKQDNTLINFLDAAAQIPGSIEKMEEYRRALDAIKMRLMKLRLHRVTDDNLIKLLHEGQIQQFNERRSELKISHPDFTNAKLAGANLSKADLSGADLSNAKLAGAKLSKADLSGANLRNSIILGVEYLSGLICDNADFKDALIDDAELSEYLENHNAKNVSPAVKDKEELKRKLEERVFSKEYIDEILNKSALT
jgi:uncharacterized protein YjbI with pentapeptide repeats